MNPEEAKAWLRGERSTNNTFIQVHGPGAEAILFTAQNDAAMMIQAYYILKAHAEGLVES
jgi:hypothetical protein